MTPEQLDSIKARVDAASSGPWMAASNTGRKDGVALVGRTEDRGKGLAVAVLGATNVRQRHKDAEFIAAARSDVPALVAEVERLRALTAACSCGDTYAAYEGPQPDCPVHGAVRAYHEAVEEVESLRDLYEKARAALREHRVVPRGDADD